MSLNGIVSKSFHLNQKTMTQRDKLVQSSLTSLERECVVIKNNSNKEQTNHETENHWQSPCR